MPAEHRAAWRTASRRAVGWCLALVAVAGLARATLPSGWSVHVFAGHVREIVAAGGVVACATDGGLLLFEPGTRTWVQIADAGCTDRRCLSSNQLTSVARDSDGRYWIGTAASGVVTFKPEAQGGEFGRFFVQNSAPGGNLIADSVSCIETWRNETVYVGTLRGVGQIDLLGAVQSYNPDAERQTHRHLRGSFVNDLAVDATWVWVATDSAVQRYDRDTYVVETTTDSLPFQLWHTVEVIGDSVYAGGDMGLYVWREAAARWRRITDAAQPNLTFKARSITRLANGDLVVGSDLSVRVYASGRWITRNPPHVFSIDSPLFVTVAASGDTLWTSEGNNLGEGAFLQWWTASGSTWHRDQPQAPPVSEMRVVSLDPQGNAWVGTQLGGVGRLATNGSWCIYNGDDPSVRAPGHMTDLSGHIFGLLADRSGSIWFSALAGQGAALALDELRPDPNCTHVNDTWAHVDSCQFDFFGGRYWRMLEDGEGNRYFLSDADLDPSGNPRCGDISAGGIDVLSADGSRQVNLRGDVLGGNRVLALDFDRHDGAWQRAYVGIDVLGRAGLKEWIRSDQLFPPNPPSAANFHALPLPTSVNVGAFRDILATGTSTRPILWVATDNGVFEYDVNAATVLTTLGEKNDARPGLLTLDTKDLQLDELGNLWIATIKGLNRIRLADRDPGDRVIVDVFTTIEIIRELNAASDVGQLYDPRRALAPLPSPKVLRLDYDRARDLLYAATSGGLAVVDVQALSNRTVLPVTGAFVYPNPVRFDRGQSEIFLANVSEPATVTIFNLEGQIVCQTEQAEAGDSVWDLGTGSCAQGNFKATSGIYLVRITTSAGSAMRNLVVIR